MIILSNQQLYSAVRNMVADLENQNLRDAAQELKAALTISSMPGEILGEIRLVLRKLERSELPPELDFEISSALTYIDSVLR